MLAEWAAENKEIFAEKRVVELGSGLGLAGIAIVCCCSPASYTFTDFHPSVLQELQSNLDVNFGSPKMVTLSDSMHSGHYFQFRIHLPMSKPKYRCVSLTGNHLTRVTFRSSFQKQTYLLDLVSVYIHRCFGDYYDIRVTFLSRHHIRSESFRRIGYHYWLFSPWQEEPLFSNSHSTGQQNAGHLPRSYCFNGFESCWRITNSPRREMLTTVSFHLSNALCFRFASNFTLWYLKNMLPYLLYSWAFGGTVSIRRLYV